MPHHRAPNFTATEDAIIREGVEARLGDREIAAMMNGRTAAGGVKRSPVEVCRRRNVLHLPVGRRQNDNPRAFTEQEEAIVRAGFEAGHSDAVIAARLKNRSAGVVRKVRVRMGLSRKQGWHNAKAAEASAPAAAPTPPAPVHHAPLGFEPRRKPQTTIDFTLTLPLDAFHALARRAKERHVPDVAAEILCSALTRGEAAR